MEGQRYRVECSVPNLNKDAESGDGIHRKHEDVVVIDFKVPEEYAISKPCVVKDGGIYRMWFCARGDVDRNTYRICYAESADGLTWERMDEKETIEVSESGWDAEMIEYLSILDHMGERYLLYAENGYRATGFGIALPESD